MISLAMACSVIGEIFMDAGMSADDVMKYADEIATAAAITSREMGLFPDATTNDCFADLWMTYDDATRLIATTITVLVS